MPIYGIHHEHVLRQRIGSVLRYAVLERTAIDGETAPGISKLFLLFDTWIAVFEDSNDIFIREQVPANGTLELDNLVLTYKLEGTRHAAVDISTFQHRSLQGFSIPEDHSSFDLVFEGGAVLSLIGARSQEEGGEPQEGFSLKARFSTADR